MKLCYILGAIAASVIAAPVDRYHPYDPHSQRPRRSRNAPRQYAPPLAGQGQQHPPPPYPGHEHLEPSHLERPPAPQALAGPQPARQDYEHQHLQGPSQHQPTSHWGQQHLPTAQFYPHPQLGHAPRNPPASGHPSRQGSRQYHSLSPPVSHSNWEQSHAVFQHSLPPSHWQRALAALDAPTGQGSQGQPPQALAGSHPGHAWEQAYAMLQQPDHTSHSTQSLAALDASPGPRPPAPPQAAPPGKDSHTSSPPPSDAKNDAHKRHEEKHEEAAETWDSAAAANRIAINEMEEAAKGSGKKAAWRTRIEVREKALVESERKAQTHRAAAKEVVHWIYGHILNSVESAIASRKAANEAIVKTRTKKWK